MKLKKVILIILGLSYINLSGVTHLSGFLNDNYTGSEENGRNGNYIGADDFLTFSLFNLISVDNHTLLTKWQVVTSRKYQYRYDLIKFFWNYELSISENRITPGIGFIYKGDLGGEEFQNDFHYIRGIPPLTLEYQEKSLAVNFSLNWERRVIGPLNTYLNLNLPTSIEPVTSTFALFARKELNWIFLEGFLGYKHYLNRIPYYSDFVRSGPVGGAQIKVRVYLVDITFGGYFFPVKNLDVDTLYKSKDIDFSPQFFVGIGNRNAYSIVDILK